MEKKVYCFLKYLIETTLLDVKCQKYSPLTMVTGAVFLVRKIYKLGDWDQELSELSGLKENSVKFCARDIYQSV